MLRIIKNKFVRNHKVYLYILLCLALCIFIHSNLNSQQMITVSLLEDKKNTVFFRSLFQTVNYSAEQEWLEVAISRDVQQQNTTAIPPANFTINTTISSPTSTTRQYWIGHVHSHQWRSMCTVDVSSLVNHPLFPLWPTLRGQPEMPDELESTTTNLWSVQRVLGLLYPPISGRYRFKIFSDTISEFWLSSTRSPKNSSLLARNNRNIIYSIEFTKGPLIASSRSVYLKHGQAYYFEIIHGHNSAGNGKVRVRWMLPRTKSFTGIPKTSVSTLLDVDDNLDIKSRELLSSSASLIYKNPELKKTKIYQWVNTTFSKPFKPYSSYTRDNLHTLKFVNRWKIMTALNECDYIPSYTVKKTYKRYEGVYSTHYTDIFPEDDTSNKWWFESSVANDMVGNWVVTEDEVINIVKIFMKAVENAFPGEYALANVVNVERNVDKERGNRFLLELLLLNVKMKQLQRLSEYVFQPKKTPGHVCKPKGLKWSPRVKVNVILTTKNQGPWVIHYIKNMAEIVHTTGDDNVHFIVVDYGNNGVDVAEEFRRNNLTCFTIIKKEGKFHKTLAIDEAAKTVKDDNSIVFLTDLHVVAPHNIFESVRKHTVQGRMAFTPVLFRLSKCSRPDGYTNTSTSSGFWEGFGYGIFGTYKSDWLNFGGVNVKEFQHKWGGEDWEMADRVLTKRIEIERLRLPYFYHYYHDKSGMWQQA